MSEWNPNMEEAPRDGTACYDCGRPYGSAGFPDLVVPNHVWHRISPTGNDGGLLCPSCLIARVEIEGIKCECALMSGPLRTISPELMHTMRWVENMREQREREEARSLPQPPAVEE